MGHSYRKVALKNTSIHVKSISSTLDSVRSASSEPSFKEEIEQDDREMNVTIDTWRVVNDDYEEDYIEIIRPYDDPERPFTTRKRLKKTVEKGM